MPLITILTFITCIVLTCGYVALMVVYHNGWNRQKQFVLPANYEPSTFISVIIPARNEAKNIGACLESIIAQRYALGFFEIIVVDDHSDDGTADVVNEYADENVRCISLADYLDPGHKINAYKKAAITAGVSNSKGELIVTTDADCVVPNAWLMHIAAAYERLHSVLIISPVIYAYKGNPLSLFQLIDFMSMQGITAAAHILNLGNMSNGANLAFSRAAFEAVGGYEGADHLASGEDYLLTMKMNKLSPGGVAYLKSIKATVVSAPPATIGGFFQQRIRWASKSGKNKDTRLTGILILVYLFNLVFVPVTLMGIADPVFYLLAAAMLLVKIIAEYYFIIPLARFYRRAWVLKYFPLFQPLHIVYIVIAGFLGFFGTYQWKGRKVS